MILELAPSRSNELIERMRVLANFFDLNLYEPSPAPVERGKTAGRSEFVQRVLWIVALAVATAFLFLKIVR